MSTGKTAVHVPRHERLFTVAEANATLPLVRAIVSDLVTLSREVVERRQRLSLLLGGRERAATDVYQDELSHIERDVEKDGRRLQEYVEELHALGVVPTSGAEGLVDFPAVLNGRKVFLCWKLGEPRVAYWHETDAGYRGRQPLGESN
jgi:hypothetical protein